jgi:hypothetical protein
MGFGFHRTIMTVSVVLLILSLILIGIALYNQKYADITFPPVVADCPDYWKNTSTDDKIKCENVKNLGSCVGEKDFSAFDFTGSSGVCAKQKWAKDCGVIWDGVTNNPDACE